jgi:hypothetical protein
MTAVVQGHYASWSSFDIRYDFDLGTPGDQAPTGTYSHIDIGGDDGDPDSLLLGIADDIDWRNLNKSDGAIIYSDEFYNWDNNYFSDYDRLVTTVAGTITHETGHILGLSHHDAFGPIGTCTPPSSFTQYPYDGGGSETNTHIMATGSTGLTKEQRTQARAFGEREAWKLDFATGQGAVFNEAASHGSMGEAQFIGGAADISVVAEISNPNQVDWYSFSARAGMLLDMEIYSYRTNRLAGNLDSVFNLYDPTGTLVLTQDDFWAYSAGYDSVLLDFVPEMTGTNYAAVYGFPGDTGAYELYLHTPEPGTLVILVLGLAMIALRLRRTGCPAKATP